MDASGLMASWFQSHSVVCLAASLSACFSGRLLTCTAGSCGIHRRDEGHGLTFVYFKGYMLCLNVVVLFPADLERDRDVWPDFSPSTDALWKPSLDRHGNAFSRAHYPDCGAPFLLPPVSQSSAAAPRPSVCLPRLAKHLLPKIHEYVDKSTKPSGPDCCRAVPSPRQTTEPFHKPYFSSPEQQKEMQ